MQVYAHGEDDGRLWIATQLVPDGDLRSMLLGHGAPPMPVAIDLIAQVADGLADAHAAGLVHRDIKPANVLLRRRADGGYTAYLADFGIARQVDGEATRTSHATRRHARATWRPSCTPAGSRASRPTSTRSAACSGPR